VAFIGGEVFGWPLRGRAVHPQAGRRGAPRLDAVLRVGQIGGHLAGEEVTAYVLDNPLHSRLVARRADPRRVGAEPPGLGIVQQPTLNVGLIGSALTTTGFMLSGTRTLNTPP
jgi:hypothetical protein